MQNQLIESIFLFIFAKNKYKRIEYGKKFNRNPQ